MADPVSRGAARTATLVALPIAVLAGVMVFWLSGGFGGTTPKPTHSPRPQPSSTVSMAAPKLGRQATTVCRGFIAQLPGTIRDRHRRPVSTGPEQNAAYGQPPLRVRCGVPAPHIAPTDTVYQLSGVCFSVAQQSGRSVWTTADRQVPVAISVPSSYSGPGQWAAEFSDSIAGTVPSSNNAPTGCG